MKGILYGVLIAAAVAVPLERVDVGKVQPIEVVAIECRDGQYYMEADTGDKGQGATVIEALEEMQKRSPGKVGLATAEYLLIGEQSAECLQEIKALLKGNVRVCYTAGELHLEDAAAYLNTHRPTRKLKDATAKNIPEILRFQNETLKGQEKVKLALDKIESEC